VKAMHAHTVKEQANFSARLTERLEGTLRDLQRLQGRQLEQLTLALENQLETVKRGRFEQRSQQIKRVFDEYREWVRDTLTTEPQPWIQVLTGVCDLNSLKAIG
ncbi:MAG: ATP-dependent helicase, partial [Burkholderiales bacterium]|nr:ATP-dependent helicase [Burkholderiales bacterium]